MEEVVRVWVSLWCVWLIKIYGDSIGSRRCMFSFFRCCGGNEVSDGLSCFVVYAGVLRFVYWSVGCV